MSQLQDLENFARQVGRSLASAFSELASVDLSETRLWKAVHNVMDSHLAQLADTGCWGRDNQRPSAAMWQEAAAWLRLGSLQLRAREKPAGYAGDFELLYRICTQDLRGTGVGRAMDHYFQQHAAPQAVRNRAEVICQEVVRRVRAPSVAVHVVSVGSGPAWELQRASQELSPADRQRLHCTLIDIDPKALEFAGDRLRHWLPADHVQVVRTNLRRLPQLLPTGSLAPPADLLFCSGYADYLDDTQMIELLRAFQHSLTTTGEWLVFHFGKDNPSRAYMEWIGNWYIVYRTATDLQRLAGEADVPHGEVQVEPAGVNLYLRGGSCGWTSWSKTTTC